MFESSLACGHVELCQTAPSFALCRASQSLSSQIGICNSQGALPPLRPDVVGIWEDKHASFTGASLLTSPQQARIQQTKEAHTTTYSCTKNDKAAPRKSLSSSSIGSARPSGPAGANPEPASKFLSLCLCLCLNSTKLTIRGHEGSRPCRSPGRKRCIRWLLVSDTSVVTTLAV